MDARKPDPATQSGDRIETRPPEDIFSSLPPEAPVPDGQPRKRSLFARIRQVFRLIFVGDAEREQRPATGMAARLLCSKRYADIKIEKDCSSSTFRAAFSLRF